MLILLGKLKYKYTVRLCGSRAACVTWQQLRGIGVLCSSHVLTQQRLFPFPFGAIGRRLIHCPPAVSPAAFSPAANDFQCLSHALACICIRWQVKAGMPRWPCHLSLLTKAYDANSMLYGIYQVDQDNKNSKEAPRKTPFFGGFFHCILYKLWIIMLINLLLHWQNELSLKNSMA